MEKKQTPQRSGKPPNSSGRNTAPRHRRNRQRRRQQPRNDSAASTQGAGVDVGRNAQDGRRLWYPTEPTQDVQGRGNWYAGERVVHSTNMAMAMATNMATNVAANFGYGGRMNGMVSYGPMTFMPGPGPSQIQPAVRNHGAVCAAMPPTEHWRAPQNGGASPVTPVGKNVGRSSYWSRSPGKQPCNGNASGAQGPVTDYKRDSQNKAEAEVKSHAGVGGQSEPHRVESDEAKCDPTSDVTKSMESMLLNFLHEPKEDKEMNPDVEGTTPFAVMALSMEPVTRDRGVVKRVVLPGWGRLVSPGSGVSFHYEAFLENSKEPFYSTRKHKRPYRCVVEEAKVVGLSFAVATMRKGEKAWVLVSPPYGCDHGSRHPARSAAADSTVLYKVELLQIIDPQDKLRLHTFVNDGALKRMPFRDVLQLCDASRQRAAALYKCDQFYPALGCYTAAIQALEEAQTDDATENAEGNEMLVGLYNNAALCSIKTVKKRLGAGMELSKAKLAVMYAERALQRNPEDANALFRCGVGLKMQSRFDKATQCLFKALKLKPDSAAIADELRAVGNLKRLQLSSSDETAYRPRPDRKFQTSDEQQARTSALDALPAERETVSIRMRGRIREQLESLKGAAAGTSLSFTVGFSDVHIDFIRASAWGMGLRCDLLKDGVVVYAPSEEASC